MSENEPRRAELYVRSLAPCGTNESQEAIVRRLLELEREGVVDDVDLTVWGSALSLDGACAQVGVGARLADRVREFFDWCEGRQASLDPFFIWSDVEASIPGESFRRVVLPQRCLAVYVGDRLAGVYPCEMDDTTLSLEDGLRALTERRSRSADGATMIEEVE